MKKLVEILNWNISNVDGVLLISKVVIHYDASPLWSCLIPFRRHVVFQTYTWIYLCNLKLVSERFPRFQYKLHSLVQESLWSGYQLFGPLLSLLYWE